MATDFFKLISPFGKVQTRSLQTDPKALLDPYSSGGADEALIMGEWCEFIDGKMQRSALYGDPGVVGVGEGVHRPYPLFVPKGYYASQAMAEPKASFLWLNAFEAETDIIEMGEGEDALAEDDLLTVQNIEDSGATPRRGLAKWTGDTGIWVIGRVTKVYTDKIRFEFHPQYMETPAGP